MPPEKRGGESSGRSLTRSLYFVQMVQMSKNCWISLGTFPCKYKARVVSPFFTLLSYPDGWYTLNTSFTWYLVLVLGEGVEEEIKGALSDCLTLFLYE